MLPYGAYSPVQESVFFFLSFFLFLNAHQGGAIFMENKKPRRLIGCMSSLNQTAIHVFQGGWSSLSPVYQTPRPIFTKYLKTGLLVWHRVYNFQVPLQWPHQQSVQTSWVNHRFTGHNGGRRTQLPVLSEQMHLGASCHLLYLQLHSYWDHNWRTSQYFMRWMIKKKRYLSGIKKADRVTEGGI